MPAPLCSTEIWIHEYSCLVILHCFSSKHNQISDFSSFVNYDKEHERNSFNIQLLKQGRMKGQAFVSFSSVETADDALRQTNGYQLLNKPMVVHFARSKKPKEPQKWTGISKLTFSPHQFVCLFVLHYLYAITNKWNKLDIWTVVAIIMEHGYGHYRALKLITTLHRRSLTPQQGISAIRNPHCTAHTIANS